MELKSQIDSLIKENEELKKQVEELVDENDSLGSYSMS